MSLIYIEIAIITLIKMHGKIAALACTFLIFKNCGNEQYLNIEIARDLMSLDNE